jgi:hypothetical protein
MGDVSWICLHYFFSTCGIAWTIDAAEAFPSE